MSKTIEKIEELIKALEAGASYSLSNNYATTISNLYSISGETTFWRKDNPAEVFNDILKNKVESNE